MKLNSKWFYFAAGANVMIAFVGALWHSLPVLLMGAGFGYWNYRVAEYNKGVENEQIRNETKTNE